LSKFSSTLESRNECSAFIGFPLKDRTEISEEKFDRQKENQPGDDDCRFSLGIWLVCDIPSPYSFHNITPHVPAFLSVGEPIYCFPICICVECSIGKKHPQY
jgi:hypothetical protein